MRVIPANIIRERRDPLIVLKEKHSKITLLNPDKKLYHEVKVDGDLYSVTETQERKCDYKVPKDAETMSEERGRTSGRK